MKLVTYTHNGRTRIGEWVEDTIYTLEAPDMMRQTIRRGITPARTTFERLSIDKVTLEAPVQPGKIICIGKNYADHAKETGSEVPEEPIVFAKLPSSVIGDKHAIQWRASVAQKVDYEAELGVIFSKRAFEVSEEHAMDYVYGYTIGNDVSARDLQASKDGQWMRSKSIDTFCPLGPCIVTKSALPDPGNIQIRTTVNGELRQDGNTRDLIFSIPKLIAYCTQYFHFEPGDLLLTGTPAGVGHGMKPPVYLADGDVISITIDGIGTLTNTCKVLA
ncbi:MAG: fumarylacetoacetate hydrolase family protein [Chloroflexota bacterium]|nr:fumarylacetoacetate hydrolase family protein [Chloroflexota bacterium]